MNQHDQNAIPVAACGSYEEGRKLLGVPSKMNVAPFPVSRDRIAAFCALIEDSNPRYWDDSNYNKLGRIAAPPAMIQAWTLALPWVPQGFAPQLQLMLLNVPLPGRTLINVSTDIVYDRLLYVGELIHFYDVVTEISDQKVTHLGCGHFVTTVCYVRNRDGDAVATITNVHLRYDPKVSA